MPEIFANPISSIYSFRDRGTTFIPWIVDPELLICRQNLVTIADADKAGITFC
jgi:hypothetical protein